MIILIAIIGQLSFWALEAGSWQSVLSHALSADSPWFWQSSRILGIIAYLLFWLCNLSGLMIGTRSTKVWYSEPVALLWHKYFGVLALALSAAHALVLGFDSYLSAAFWQLATPFALTQFDGARYIAGSLGQLGFYALAVVVIGNYLSQLSKDTWKILHACILLGYAAVVAHALFLGTDSHEVWLSWLYLCTNAVLILVLIYRVLTLRK